METIKELRESLQREKLEGRERPWGYASLQRGPSIYFTYLLARTPIRPNHVTLLSIACGIAGGIFISYGSWPAHISGLVLIYANLLLDRVDGELARYKKIYSLKGIYLDELNHLIIPPFFFLSLGLGLGRMSAALYPEIPILLGAIAAVASIIIRVTHNLHYGIYLKKFTKHPEFFPASENSASIAHLRSSYTWSYSVLRVVHQLHDFLITILIFAIVAIIERIQYPDYAFFPLTSWLFLGYAIFLLLVACESTLKGLLTVESHMQDLSRTE